MNLRNTILSVLLISVSAMHAIEVKWIYSTDDARWQDGGQVQISQYNRHESNDVMITNNIDQEIKGFGGCFNELGWIALSNLSKSDRKQIIGDLFSADGVNFTICRTPIGANDFSTEWFSYDETDADFDLKHFSIKHDKKNMIPYIKSALKVNPGLKIWASPWSAPQWMKTNNHYSNRSCDFNGLMPDKEVPLDNDQMHTDDKYLLTYANYFSRYLDEYKKHGINIYMVQPQNEPYTFNIWPNCSWKHTTVARFIGDFLGPTLKANHPEVEIWLGTMNTDRKDHIDEILSHPSASKYIGGVAFQWEGKDIITDVHRSNPDLALMQSENECGGGENNWSSGEHTIDLIKHYIDGGAGMYMYFNMVLQDDCASTWHWTQNTMVRVDSNSKSYTYTPEYYAMKHVSHFVKPGARRLQVLGLDDHIMAFLNPDGSTILVAGNHGDNTRHITINYNNDVITVDLKPHSFNTFTII